MGPAITVLMPARDEAADIGAALAAVRGQDHPLDDIEVVLVDGGSTDDTVAQARRQLEGAGFARVAIVDNPAGTTPSNLNRGLEEATGVVVCRVDARSLVPPDYVRRCAAILADRPEVAVVGGRQAAVVRDGGLWPAAVARALNNPWATGLARYRRATISGATDTVYLGAFRRRDLLRVGGWDEALPTNQDFDLNRRMGRRGEVWFEAGLDVGYLPRRSLGSLVAQHVRFGRAKVAYWHHTCDRPRSRQLVIIGAPLVVAVTSTAWILRGPVLPRAGFVAGIATAAGFAVDAAGARGAPASLPVRAASVAAMGGIAGGWLSGVLDGFARGR